MWCGVVRCGAVRCGVVWCGGGGGVVVCVCVCLPVIWEFLSPFFTSPCNVVLSIIDSRVVGQSINHSESIFLESIEWMNSLAYYPTLPGDRREAAYGLDSRPVYE